MGKNVEVALDSSEHSSERASILIVDDNPLIRNVIQTLFSYENFVVQTAANGHEALEKLQSGDFDVIVCDIMMPRMDGIEFFEQVRSNEALSHIPFVFLTALDSDDDKKKCWQLGCDGYMTKPFDPDLLISTVKGKVNRSRNIKQAFDHNQDKFRKRVLHTLSHEFRTPLVAINTGTEILLDDVNRSKQDDSAKTKRLLEAILRGGQRLERLVNDFMLLQQIEAGVANGLFKLRSSEYTVASLIDCYLAGISPLLEEQGFAITVTNHTPDIKVKVYQPQIIEILNRITDNSIKFSQNSKTIDLLVRADSKEVILSIADNGQGFDPVAMKNSISMFTQLDRDHYEQQGGGLGLAIASKYAEINGCKLSFDSRPQGGAIVNLHMPLVH